MPLHGKIVVVKRSGGDGTEFPLTATCMFGRKPDCDIRIQLPQVSKEHCRIDLNENKEVILTNLSSVNPTRVNGEALQQSERLKHGDVITIIDRSFRFEYPPAPTPRKTPKGSKTETFKVLQDQHSGDTVDTAEKRVSQVSKDPHLKDGTNHDNIQRSLEKSLEYEAKDASLLQSKTTSPFSDLYQMIKKSLDVKTPARKSPGSKLQTPSSKLCTPKAKPARENKAVISSEKKSTPKQGEAKVSAENDESVVEAKKVTPKSNKKQRRSSQSPCVDKAGPEIKEAKLSAQSKVTSPQTRQLTSRSTPQKFTVGEVIEQVTTETQKSPTRRRSKEVTPGKNGATKDQKESDMLSCKAASQEKSKKRKSGELELTVPQMKKKRVSFGGYLSPELFDKKMPPDSPLRKGATPRRSLCLSKPKLSLLRRASVIGLLEEFDQEHMESPKTKNASPKSAKAKGASPKATPEKKSPKSRSSPKDSPKQNKSPKPKTPSPKRPTPQKKSPNAKSESPKRRSPSTNKAQTPTAREQPLMSTPGQVAAKETPSGKRRAPQALLTPITQENTATPAVTPSNSQVQTSTVQGRFSVSRISTPSPVAEDVKESATPKIPLKRKSMKSSARKTPALARSAIKVMQRRSGISRASMKAKISFADMVKFGRAKVQTEVPAKKAVQKRPVKKAVSKPRCQTPAKKLMEHVSTGHANSPATIVVGKALKKRVVYPTGTAPKVVLNTAVFKKNMKMDEDLSGISEMFKTPANEKKRSGMEERCVAKTPVLVMDPQAMEPSLLNTPEEPGEMAVSPMSLASTMKGREYNSEAVKRLLDGNQESSFICDTTALEAQTTESCEELKTPKLKPEPADCLTGVKRIMKTPRQKTKPVEDLRGKLLKTPKQKIEQPDCLTGVKRVMKTPKEKAEPVEDLRGKLLKTPKQKIEQPDCLTGVKNLMETPQHKVELCEDLSVTLLKTPKQAPEEPECVTAVSDLMKTPQQEAMPVENLCGTPLETPKQVPEHPECLTGVKNMMKTPQQKAEPTEDLRGKHLKTPKQKLEQAECLTGVKRIMKTPKEKAEPLEDIRGALLVTPKQKPQPVLPLTGVKEIFETPEWEDECLEEVGVEKIVETNNKEVSITFDGPEVDNSSGVYVRRTPKVKNAPVEDMVGVKRLMKTPKEKGKAIEENFGIKRLMQSPKLRGNAPVDDFEGLQELMEEPATESTEQIGEVKAEAKAPMDCVADIAKDLTCGETQETLPSESENTPSDLTVEDVTGNANKDTVDQMEVESVQGVDESSVAKEATLEAVVENSPEEEHQEETAACQVTELETAAVVDEKKSVRGRRAKPATAKQEVAEKPEDSAVATPARGRRGRKVEAVAAPAARQTTKGRRAKASDSGDVELAQEEAVPPPSKAAPKPRRGRNAKVGLDEPEVAQEVVTETTLAPEAENPLLEEKVTVKPKRGRKPRQEPEQPQPATKQEDLTTQSENDPQEMQTNEVSSEQVEIATSDESKPSVAQETLPESVMEAEIAETNAVIVPKKSVRGRRAKVVESSAAEEDKTEASNVQQQVDAPVRGRRGRKPEAAAPPPAVKQTRRGRNPKSEDQVEIVPVGAVEPEVVAMVSNANNQTSGQEDVQEPVMKPSRGRKPKVAQPQQEQENSSEHLTAEQPQKTEQPQEPTPTAGKPRRGRKLNPAASKQVEEPAASKQVEEPSASVETKEEPPVRSKRGRGAQLADIHTDTAEPSVCQQPIKTSRRTKKVEQDAEEPQVETMVPEEAEPVAPKNRRGGRKTKKDAESVTMVESTETHCDATAPADKPKRGRRAKPAEELPEVTEEKQQTEEKPGRAKAVVPAKRARRGAATLKEDTREEVPEEAPASAAPPRKGRRGAAKPAVPDPVESVDKVDPPEDANALVEDTKTSKRSVKWRDLEAPKATPVKAVRGRKLKLDQSETVSENTNATEEKVLSDDVVAQPAKRARRGGKIAEEAEPTSKTTSKKGAVALDSETQPKSRRGRSAKK